MFQQQVQQFWQCCSNDYLHSLQQRHRWLKATPKLQLVDLVLMNEDNTAPLQGPKAVNQEIQYVKNGIVRVVAIKIPKRLFKRSTSKICPLLFVPET